MTGGIQANTDKTDPAWIHSGEPGTSGREPFEDSTSIGSGHHERQHEGYQSGGNAASGFTGGAFSRQADCEDCDNGLTTEHQHRKRGGASGGAFSRSADCDDCDNGITTEHQHRRHGQHHQGQGLSGETLGRSGVTGERGYDNNNTGSQGGYKDFDNNPSFGQGATGATGGAFDRVGDRNEGGANYERTGAGGPVTGGAAGTDRFDTDKHRDTGDYGRDVGTGATRGVGDRSEDSAYERTGGGQVGAGNSSGGPTTGTGGGLISGLTTSDNEFTGKDRSHTGPNVGTAGGAYEDTSGPFKGNTSGPGGNTALTGREGSTGQNPVAQASHTGATSGDATGRVGQTEQATEHKGFVQKIKDML